MLLPCRVSVPGPACDQEARAADHARKRLGGAGVVQQRAAVRDGRGVRAGAQLPRAPIESVPLVIVVEPE